MLTPSKLIGSIDREVRSLTTSLDAGATHLMASHPEAGLTVRRVPERFVLQAGDVAVSISLFRSRAGLEANAEVVLAVWRGEVTFPGATPRAGRQATQLRVQQFRIMACDTPEPAPWLWIDEATTETLTSQALATLCIGAMADCL